MLYSTEQAAVYCKMSLPAIKYHIHTTKLLCGQLIGHSLIFTKAELDAFLRVKRPQGRPRLESSQDSCR